MPSTTDKWAPKTQKLTHMERKLVALILYGSVTTKDLANALTMSQRTVQTHLTHIYDKTGASNMVELVLMAIGLKSPVHDCGVDTIANARLDASVLPSEEELQDVKRYR